MATLKVIPKVLLAITLGLNLAACSNEDDNGDE